MFKKNFFFILTVLHSAHISFAQTVVMDSIYRVPLPGVIVTDVNGSFICVSDNNGIIQTDNNKECLLLSCLGYEKKCIQSDKLETEILLSPIEYKLKKSIPTQRDEDILVLTCYFHDYMLLGKEILLPSETSLLFQRDGLCRIFIPSRNDSWIFSDIHYDIIRNGSGKSSLKHRGGLKWRGEDNIRNTSILDDIVNSSIYQCDVKDNIIEVNAPSTAVSRLTHGWIIRDTLSGIHKINYSQSTGHWMTIQIGNQNFKGKLTNHVLHEIYQITSDYSTSMSSLLSFEEIYEVSCINNKNGDGSYPYLFSRKFFPVETSYVSTKKEYRKARRQKKKYTENDIEQFKSQLDQYMRLTP